MSEDERDEAYPPHRSEPDMIREPEVAYEGGSSCHRAGVGLGEHGRRLVESGRLSVPKLQLARLGRPVGRPCSTPISQALREMRAEG